MFASVVMCHSGKLRYIRFECQDNSALAELEALQASISLSLMYLHLGYRVVIRSDCRTVVDSFTKALAGFDSKAPICKKMLDFVQNCGSIVYSKNLKVEWIKGHNGESLNEIADWLTKHETLDNIDRFMYFKDVKCFGKLTD
jgi:ribonuclease HI